MVFLQIQQFRHQAYKRWLRNGLTEANWQWMIFVGVEVIAFRHKSSRGTARIAAMTLGLVTRRASGCSLKGVATLPDLSCELLQYGSASSLITSSAQQLTLEVATDRRRTQPCGKQSIREVLTRNCHLQALAAQYCAGTGQVRESEHIPFF